MAKAVSLIVAASHAAAVEALNEAFGSNKHRDETSPRRRGTPCGASSQRRTGAEIAALEAKFFDAVLASPGEAMSVLAPRIGAPPSLLQVPLARLRSAGRLKTVGSRQFTRYFPIVGGEGGHDEAAN